MRPLVIDICTLPHRSAEITNRADILRTYEKDCIMAKSGTNSTGSKGGGQSNGTNSTGARGNGQGSGTNSTGAKGGGGNSTHK